MSMVIRLKVPIEMHYTVIPMGTSKVNSSRIYLFRECCSQCRFQPYDCVTGCGGRCLVVCHVVLSSLRHTDLNKNKMVFVIAVNVQQFSFSLTKT